ATSSEELSSQAELLKETIKYFKIDKRENGVIAEPVNETKIETIPSPTNKLLNTKDNQQPVDKTMANF
ncbi:MAG: hypothetical protein MI922_07205, partial [Bacteroidales bacterium]|nr:hypothetical protein [Bacteroidales bacterium]